MRVCVCVPAHKLRATGGRRISGKHRADAKALGQATAEAVLEPVTGRRAKPLGVLRLG